MVFREMSVVANWFVFTSATQLKFYHIKFFIVTKQTEAFPVIFFVAWPLNSLLFISSLTFDQQHVICIFLQVIFYSFIALFSTLQPNVRACKFMPQITVVVM